MFKKGDRVIFAGKTGIITEVTEGARYPYRVVFDDGIQGIFAAAELREAGTERHNPTLYARYEGYKPQWEGFINLGKGDILQTSCGHGTRTGQNRVYIIVELDGNFHCYCKECEKEILKTRRL